MASLVIWLALASARLNGEVIPRFSTYERGTGNGSDLFFDLVEGSAGELLVAGRSLLTFDGDHWSAAERVPNNFAFRKLAAGEDGRIWAAGMSELGWFARASDGAWRYTSLLDRLPATRPLAEGWHVTVQRNRVLFVTLDEVLSWDGRAFARWPLPTPQRLIPFEVGGVLYVHRIEHGTYRIGAHGPELAIPLLPEKNSAVFWAEQHGTRWLLGTTNGFFHYDGVHAVPFAPDVRDYLARHRLTNILRRGDGRLAVGTYSGGLLSVTGDGEVEYRLTVADGAPSNYIEALAQTRDGNFWVATRGHLLRVEDDAKTTVFSPALGLPPSQGIAGIARSRGHLYAAGQAGIYELAPGEKAFRLTSAAVSRPQLISPSPQGLVISGHQGTTLWDGSSLVPLLPSPLDAFSFAASRVRPGRFLIGDRRSVVETSPGGPSRTVVSSLPDNPISLAEDARGQLWIGTLGQGLLVAQRVETGSVQARRVDGSAGLPRLTGRTCVRATSTGALLVVADNGAWHQRPHTSAFEPVPGYLPREDCAIAEPAIDDSIWIAQPRAALLPPTVGRVAWRAGNAVWESHSLDALPALGAITSIFAEVTQQATTLWIGGAETLLRHQVGPVLSNPAPRPPVVRAYFVGTRDERRSGLPSEVPYDTESIRFEIASPEYARRALLRLETRIDGIDEHWIPVGRDSVRELSALRDGDYRFRARVVSETGRPSPERHVAFRVLPPWWRTPSAVIAFGLALVPLGYSAYRLRTRSLRRRNEELEAKVRERTVQLEAANAAKTEFVASMSHDIRNPLNGIVGLTLALEDSRLEPRQREIVASLRGCATYLASLVDDVLDFASIEAGKVELRPAAFAPADQLAAVAAMLRTEAGECGADLALVADPQVPALLFGDTGRIQQILANFVSNALKYAGGEITVRVCIPPGAPGEVEFSVTDHGPGIAPADQVALFTKFTRLASARRRQVPGTGLGLASCRHLADAMGGSVGVESEPGHGARFFLRLPLVVPESDSAPADPAATGAVPMASVLLVEDEEYNAWAASAVLRRLGLTCEHARTGAEAVRMFAAKPFNLVLLDRNLPDMDGVEVARQLRALELHGPNAVLLAVTAYCTPEDRQVCLDAGMDAFVGKPVTPEKLRAVLLAASRRLLASASLLACPPPDAAPGPTDETQLDLSQLAYLGDDSDRGLEEQIERFLAALARTLANLNAVAAARDFEALVTAAHDVVGHARQVGAGPLAEAARRVEQAARRGETAAAIDGLAAVAHEADRLRAAMHRARPAALAT